MFIMHQLSEIAIVRIELLKSVRTLKLHIHKKFSLSLHFSKFAKIGSFLNKRKQYNVSVLSLLSPYYLIFFWEGRCGEREKYGLYHQIFKSLDIFCHEWKINYYICAKYMDLYMTSGGHFAYSSLGIVDVVQFHQNFFTQYHAN